tara:strand:+ start:8432 stop:10402 length:1971 start_codon:yes stop_codon:yes gene_type:complete
VDEGAEIMIQALAFLALFLPLLSAIGLAVGGKHLSRRAVYGIATGSMALTGMAALLLWLKLIPDHKTLVTFWSWLDVILGTPSQWPILKSDFAVRLDVLTLAMMMLVGVISTLVHGYAYGYMRRDPGALRFACLLNLFTFFMNLLVAANDLGQMFVGWEGVGVISFLLIGFWYEKPTAKKAAMKAFWVNRVGDAFLILGVVGLFCSLGSLNYSSFEVLSDFNIYKTLPMPDHYGVENLRWSLVLIILGAMTKSAQIGFHVWLPDAMEGPTPVSALLHSATMVTAGAFLLIRLNPLLQHFPELHAMIVVVGVLTALLAGAIAIAQTNLKPVIAYSTCSQLGFMFIAIGVSAYGLALFHLITHAFFKSLLFLGAGVVSEKCDHEQDITKMGGLWRRLPITHILMLLGVLALVGAPLFSGAISKDLILEAAWAYPGHAWMGWFAYGGGLIAVALTGIYAWRLMILVFYGGGERPDKGPSEPDLWAMWVPMVPLAVGALALGSILKPWFVGSGEMWLWEINFGDLSERLARAHQVPCVTWAIMAMVGCTTVVTFVMFGWLRLNEAWLRTKLGRFLHNQAFFNEMYQRLFVWPLSEVSGVCGAADDTVIDQGGPGMVVRFVKRLNKCVCWLQSGYVYRYALFMVLGGLVMVTASLFWIGVK